MAYDKEEIFNQAKQVITEHELIFIEEAVAYLPCQKATFYVLFPAGSDEMDEIKALINANKVNAKASMRKNWGHKDAPAALQIAKYKLCATEEEREILNNKEQAKSGDTFIVQYGNNEDTSTTEEGTL